MRPGYKKTEVGVIPEEWEAVRAGDIGSFRGGNGFPTKFQGSTSGDYPFFKVSDMNNEGNETFMLSSNNWISEGVRKQLGATAFPPYTIVFAKVGAAVFLERKKILAMPSCVDNNMASFVLDGSRANFRFLHYLLLNTKLGDLVSTTALPSLSGSVLTEIEFPLPPLPEQRVIAVALSDVDALISGLDKLIAKKRDIKQAAMQQLLTGKQRLPGFSGEWEVKRFGEIATPRKERIDPRKAGAQEFCVELEHIEQGSGRLVGNTSAGDQSSLKSTFQVGDVLFGKLRAYLRKYWLSDRLGVCSTEIWALMANRRLVTPEFLFQLVTVDQFIEAASTAYGTHMPRSDWNVVKN